MMKKFYYGGGKSRSLMVFGGVVPEIKRLDYEIPYIEPGRIYGVDSKGNIHKKDKNIEPKGIENINNFLIGGDDGRNVVNEEKPNILEHSTNIKKINDSNINYNIGDYKDKHYGILHKETNTPLNHVESSIVIPQSTSLDISTLNESVKALELEKLKIISTPIKPPEIPLEEYSKEIAEMTPKLMDAWKTYKTNVQEQMKKAKLPKQFNLPKIFKNNKHNNIDVINHYQDNKLKSLGLSSTTLGPIIEEPQTIGITHSLINEFQMYRESFKIQRQNPSVLEVIKPEILKEPDRKKLSFIQKIKQNPLFRKCHLC
uniref:Uncharacterized protein n=1 Tax=Parastrongyloides trichosuri TaxID=131310 RepID=A0A0N4ZIL7_PARTI